MSERAPFRILFVCTGNSCRSQIAEAFARQYGGAEVEVYSCGPAPAGMNPRAVRVMAERNVDLSGQYSKPLDEAFAAQMDVVITLCGDPAEVCPTVRAPRVVHWPLHDPARARGTEDEVMAVFRDVRDELETRVHGLLAELRDEEGSPPTHG
jgi:arsenate reductase